MKDFNFDKEGNIKHIETNDITFTFNKYDDNGRPTGRTETEVSESSVVNYFNLLIDEINELKKKRGDK